MMQNAIWSAVKRLKLKAALGAFSAAIFFSACGGGKPDTTVHTAEAVIDEFKVTPDVITKGDKAKLSWKYHQGVGRITIQVEGENTSSPLKIQDSETVGSEGSVEIDPILTSTYTLSVTNPAGQSVKSKVYLKVAKPQEIISPACTTEHQSGYSAKVNEVPGATYTWQIENGQIEEGSQSRSILFQAGKTGTLKLTCRINAPNQVFDAAGEIKVVPAPVIKAFYAKQPIITQGKSTELVYTFENGTATLTPSTIQNTTTPGTYKVTPPDVTTYYYTLSVTNEAKTTISETRPIEVVLPPKITKTSKGTDLFHPITGTDLTVDFTGTEARLYPGDLPLKSGEAIHVHPFHPMLYEIRAMNKAGDFDIARIPVYPASVIAAGSAHTVACQTSKGWVRSWGLDDNGQLGYAPKILEPGQPSYTILPEKVIEASGSLIQNASSVWAGAYHTLALRDKELWGWGRNASAQLGQGETSERSQAKAFKPENAPKEILSVATGWGHTLVLAKDGLHSCGWNLRNQLGMEGEFNALNKVQLDNVVAISAGGLHSLALKSDGTVWSWGSYIYDGSPNSELMSLESKAPKQISELQNIVAIASGHMHALALQSDGTIWAWGDNRYGSLGNGQVPHAPKPVKVAISGVVAICSNYWHNFAQTKDGKLFGWGHNPYGQVDATLQNQTLPVEKKLEGRVFALATGHHHSVAMLENGNVWTWGNVENGQAGHLYWKGDWLPPIACKEGQAFSITCNVKQNKPFLGSGYVGVRFEGENGNSFPYPTPVLTKNPDDSYTAQVINAIAPKGSVRVIFYMEMVGVGGLESYFSDFKAYSGPTLEGENLCKDVGPKTFSIPIAQTDPIFTFDVHNAPNFHLELLP